jgi:hypothetical protein
MRMLIPNRQYTYNIFSYLKTGLFLFLRDHTEFAE